MHWICGTVLATYFRKVFEIISGPLSQRMLSGMPCRHIAGQRLDHTQTVDARRDLQRQAGAIAGQREHSLREVFNGLRYVVKTGAPWRWMPNDLPPWEIVYQQAQRWLAAGCFEQLADDLRALLRLASGRSPQSLFEGLHRPSPSVSFSNTGSAWRGGVESRCGRTGIERAMRRA